MGTGGKRCAVSKRPWESGSDFHGRVSFHRVGLRSLCCPFVAYRGFVAQRGMPPVPVVPALDELEQDQPRLPAGRERLTLQEFGLQRALHALCLGLVFYCTCPAERWTTSASLSRSGHLPRSPSARRR